MKYEIVTHNLQETEALAKRLGNLCFNGTVIALEGDLGAGKTIFTQGLAKALHINKVVNSPTFTIIKEYSGDMPLYHMDVYRLNNESEDLGFDEYFYASGVTVVEWASRIEKQLPKNRLEINVYVLGETVRRFEFIPKGADYEKICVELFI